MFHISQSFLTQIQLVKGDLSLCTLDGYKGKYVVMSIFPCFDTGVCAISVRKFSALAASHPRAVVLCISRDLPFAQSRFCSVEGIANVVPLSDFRHGVEMSDGPLAGLLARAIVVIAPDGKVCHAQLVPEITTEPDYDAALAVVNTTKTYPPSRNRGKKKGNSFLNYYIDN